MEATLVGTKSVEVRTRLSRILMANTFAPASIRPEERRRQRVDYILELIGTDSAKELRSKWSQRKKKRSTPAFVRNGPPRRAESPWLLQRCLRRRILRTAVFVEFPRLGEARDQGEKVK